MEGAALLGQVQVCINSGHTLSAVGLLAGTRCKKRFLDMFSCWRWRLLTSSNKKIAWILLAFVELTRLGWHLRVLATNTGAQVDKWQRIAGFGAIHKAFGLDFCSAVMMRVDEEDSVESVVDEGGDDDDDDGDEGQDDEDDDDDEDKEGDYECDGDEPQRSRRFR